MEGTGNLMGYFGREGQLHDCKKFKDILKNSKGSLHLSPFMLVFFDMQPLHAVT